MPAALSILAAGTADNVVYRSPDVSSEAQSPEPLELRSVRQDSLRPARRSELIAEMDLEPFPQRFS